MNYNFKSIDSLEFSGKVVIVRSNLDVPISDGIITDETRIKASIKTIQYLSEKGAKVVVIGHIGKPNGKYVDDLSLMPVRFALGKLLNNTIKFASIESCKNSITFMNYGDILLLENLRFNPGEESKNESEREEFIKNLASYADIYINDCFGTYRKHASVYDITKYLPSYAGFNIIEEINNLNKLENAQSPFSVLIGGKNADLKLQTIRNFLNKADKILIGGAVTYTFLKAKNISVGKSFVDDSKLEEAKDILSQAKTTNCEIILPIDHVASDELVEYGDAVYVDNENIPDDLIGLDIGEKTIELFLNELKESKTILWTGPMGVYEWDNYSNGTQKIGDCLSLDCGKDAFKVLGGGDTISACNRLKIKLKKFDLVSLGGGMMLKYLSGEKFEILDKLSQN